MPRSGAQIARSEQQMIQIGRRQLGLDDDTYRAMLKRLTGKTSSKDLDWSARKKVIDHMKAAGALAAKKRDRTPKVMPPLMAKVEALLADLGLPWSYADAIAANITGGKKPVSIKRVEWVPEWVLRGIIADLERLQAPKLVKAKWALARRCKAGRVTRQQLADLVLQLLTTGIDGVVIRFDPQRSVQALTLLTAEVVRRHG